MELVADSVRGTRLLGLLSRRIQRHATSATTDTKADIRGGSAKMATYITTIAACGGLWMFWQDHWIECGVGFFLASLA